MNTNVKKSSDWLCWANSIFMLPDLIGWLRLWLLFQYRLFGLFWVRLFANLTDITNIPCQIFMEYTDFDN